MSTRLTTHPDVEAETQRQATAMLFRNAEFALGVHLVNAALLVGVITYAQPSKTAAVAWWGLVSIAAINRYLLARWFRRAQPDAAAAAIWRRRYVIATTLLSAAWGLGAPLFMWNGSDEVLLFTGLVLAGMVGAKYLHRTLNGSIRLGLETAHLAESLKEANALAERALSERKALAESTRRERDFAESLIDTAQAMVVVLDLEARIVRINRYTEDLSGYTLVQVQGTNWYSIFSPPELREMARLQYDAMIQEGGIQTNISQILTRDGRKLTVEWRDKTLEDADGNTIGMLAIGLDVTQREKLVESQRLLSAAVAQSPMSIVVADASGSIVFVNDGFTRTTGYSWAEAIGENPRVLKSGHTPMPVYEELWSALTSGRPWFGEFLNKKKNGELYWEEARISPIVDAIGRITHFLAVKEDITQRKEMEEELKRLATTDPLTGVANRRRFLEEVEMELARHRRFQKPSSLLMLDIDHFKHTNDTHGHAMGDALLKHLAGLSRLRLRRLDLFGRLGGEEFGILLPGTDGPGARIFADQFRAFVADNPLPSSMGPLPMTISIGVTGFDPGDEGPDSILVRADQALYRAKTNGRNRVEVG